MIMQLKGTVTYKGSGFVVIDISGIGYKVHIPQSILAGARENAEISLWTHLAVRENAMELFGFTSKEELGFFEMLIDVSGIGPKSALAILNLAPIEQLQKAIAAGDSTYLIKVSGIGRKTAGKIIVELKDRLAGLSKEGDSTYLKEEMEALEALRALGYGTKDAREALSKIKEETQGINEKIKEALKLLSR